MFAILIAQLQKLRRNPSTLIIMMGFTILFSVMLGVNSIGNVTVYTYHDSAMERSEAEKWVERLNRSDSFTFKLVDETVAANHVIDANAEFALKLLPNDYRIIAAVDNMNIATLDLYVRTVYDEEFMIRQAEAAGNVSGLREQLEERLAAPTLTIQSSEVDTGGSFEYDARVQSLFGFALFFSIYTIAYSVSALLYDKQNRVWDRVILSPVSKTAMYAGHLLNSFLAGYMQIVIVFALFRYVFDFPLGDSFATILVLTGVYVFAIVALGMLMAGLVRTPQQMSVLIPIVGVSSAMIGGAYWPIEIVTNPILIGLSKIIPVTYGMEALKGVAYYGHSWGDLIEPISYMMLFGVVCMGLGINLVERRAQ